MRSSWFSKPVQVSVGLTGGIRSIENPDEAIDLLANHWRNGGSQKHQAALLDCRRAKSGTIPADVARQSFVEAAREARVLVE
jgi:hypothetical protein